MEFPEKMEYLVQGVLLAPLVLLEVMAKMEIRELEEKMASQENQGHRDLQDLRVVLE